MFCQSPSAGSENGSYASSCCYEEKAEDMVHYASTGTVLSLSLTKDRLVDTGLRLQARGGIALYGVNGFQVIGLCCCECQGPTLDIRPWSHCAECGDLLWELLLGNAPPREYTRDPVSGSIAEVMPATTPAPTVITSCPSMEDLSLTEGSESCAPAGDKKPFRPWASRGRGRGSRHAAPPPGFATPASEISAPPKEIPVPPTDVVIIPASVTGEQTGLTGEGSASSPVSAAVIFRRPGRKDLVYFVHSLDKDGKPVQLPDPSFYT